MTSSLSSNYQNLKKGLLLLLRCSKICQTMLLTQDIAFSYEFLGLLIPRCAAMFQTFTEVPSIPAGLNAD